MYFVFVMKCTCFDIAVFVWLVIVVEEVFFFFPNVTACDDEIAGLVDNMVLETLVHFRESISFKNVIHKEVVVWNFVGCIVKTKIANSITQEGRLLIGSVFVIFDFVGNGQWDIFVSVAS